MRGTLEETLAALDQVIDQAVAENSRLALFPAMYRMVTAALHRAVSEGGFFDDDERLERLAVQFAGYYLGAHSGYRSGREICRCWYAAFAEAESGRKRTILQHLLLGMNAHINFDLGIATARIAGEDLASLHGDFIRVNEILLHLVDQLQGALSTVSPRMGVIDRLGWRLDEAFMRLSIRTARDYAWDFAEQITTADDPRPIIRERDDDSCFVADLMIRRWSPISLFAWVVAAGETKPVADVVAALSSVDIDLELVADRSREEMAAGVGVSTPLRDAVRPRAIGLPRRAGRSGLE